MALLEVAKKAALAGGDVLLRYAGKKLSFEKKQDKTYVSQADRDSEDAIRKIILAAYPDHAINGEEFGKIGKSSTIWHVDPLDGTINFKSGIPASCVSIGVEQDGRFVVGVIYNPFTNELYFAEEGKGAYLNDERITVSSLSLAEGFHLIDASFRDDRAKRKMQYMHSILQHASKLRMIGSNALQLAEVARGSCVASLSDAIHSYDFAAGIVIVKEAGGNVTDQHGNEPTAASAVVIASNSKENHEKILHAAQSYDGYAGM
jgi:myo-inositol-1(or 4)-monophosphatase